MASLFAGLGSDRLPLFGRQNYMAGFNDEDVNELPGEYSRYTGRALAVASGT
jgi:hypothetical protein